MYNQQQTLDDLILSMVDFCVLLTALVLSYPRATIFQPVERPSALQELISKQKKPELSEGTRLALDPDPMAIVWQAQSDFSECLHISLP